ncbi:DUF732 domain-containing protein [Mycobacterium sp.]|uniref:DUF732 domain-containing protein n=1 Tax=Mycobacterium sp. TaxID=1785 RepID=UPI002BD574A9|nr:DUF732 domain-containing protein [Mycobacterium sp.]HTQ17886.1 DUF732 domain-containing protein [Mycobacterium sp.]
MKRMLATLLALPSAALVLAPTANANGNSYLAELSQHGIIINNPAGLIADGYSACGAWRSGGFNAATAAVRAHNPRLTDYDVGYVVGAAIKNLC